MSTVIDAFLVTLGLEAGQFDATVKKVIEDQLKLREEMDNTAQHAKTKGEEAGEFFNILLARAGALFALFTAGKGIKDFIVGSIEAKGKMYEFASSLNINIENVQSWGRAVKNEGGTAEGFQSSIQGMTTKLAALGTKLRGAKQLEMVLGMAGLTKEAVKGKDAFEVMLMLSEKMAQKPPGQAFLIGRRAGMDVGTIRLLMKGREEVMKLTEEQRSMGVYSLESAKAADALDDSWNDAKTTLSKAVGFIAAEAVPVLQVVVNWARKFGDWAREHKEVMKTFFVVLGTGLAMVGAAALKMGAQMALGWIIGLGPVGWIIAALSLVGAGIAWVYTEWKKWTEGGQSSLAKLFQFFKGIWDSIKGFVTTTFNFIRQQVEDYIGAMIATFKLFWALLTLDGAGVKEAWDKLTTALGRIMKRLFNYILYELGYFIGVMTSAWDRAWDDMKEKARRTLEFIRDWWRDLNPAMKTLLLANPITGAAALGMTVDAYRHPSSAALRPSMMTSHSSAQSTRSVVIQEMNVNAPQATDANGIAQGMGSALANEDLIASLDTGS